MALELKDKDTNTTRRKDDRCDHDQRCSLDCAKRVDAGQMGNVELVLDDSEYLGMEYHAWTAGIG